MYRIKVRIDTQSDVIKFVQLAESIEDYDVFLEDSDEHCVSAKSLLGVMYGKVEFREIFVRSDYSRMSNIFKEFMI
jgi:hypothetical protein